MREIKFRLWDKENEVMHKNVQFITSGNESNDWIIFKSDIQTLENGEVLENPYFVEQFEIEQYTGLKDKNGVEIYVGDIVAIKDSLGYEWTKEVVEAEYGFGLKGNYDTSPLQKVYGYNDGHFGCDVTNEFQVIGNIHEV